MQTSKTHQFVTYFIYFKMCKKLTYRQCYSIRDCKHTDVDGKGHVPIVTRIITWHKKSKKYIQFPSIRCQQKNLFSKLCLKYSSKIDAFSFRITDVL